MKTLAISSDLKLPIDAATQTFAFIARKGAGKTYAAGKLVELLLKADVQVVVIDTVGNWYGLRLAADGKGKGFDVPVFGGLRGDLPLQAQAGELVADVAVDSGRSLILDLSQFSLGDRKRFATAFGERLWKKKKAESHPSPLMLVIEESQLIIPQFTRGDDSRMVGIYEEIIRLGRNYGIGCTMISQRPQSVNKEVLNQTECLFVLQVNGAQERKALKDWITHQGMDPALLDELPSLPIGTAYVWSPQWLGILKKVKIAKKETFDASATPKVGDRTTRRDPAPLDLADLQKQMAATIETAKQNDPRALKQQVAELRTELAKAQKATPAAKVEKKEVPVLKDGQLNRLATFVKDFDDARDRLKTIIRSDAERLVSRIEAVDAVIKPFRDALMRIAQPLPHSISRPQVAPAARPAKAPSVVSPPARVEFTPVGGDLTLSKKQQDILDALAWFESIGNSSPSGVQLGAVALIDASGGHFSNVAGPLSSHGLIVRGNGVISLTDKGRQFARVPESVGTLDDYHDVLRQRVRKVKSAGGKTIEILNAIIARGGADLTAEEIGQEVGIDHTGGHFSNTIGPLGTLGLIQRSKGLIHPTEIIFPPGLS